MRIIIYKENKLDIFRTLQSYTGHYLKEQGNKVVQAVDKVFEQPL